VAYSGTEHFDLMKLLVPHMAAVPAWRDLIEATSETLERHVEYPRRRLERIRDTVVYRKDDIIKNVPYLEGTVVDTETGENVVLQKGTVVPSARILMIEQNAPTSVLSGIDYMLVEFTLSDNRVFHWKMPINAPQERSILIQNGNMLGFDFFNTTLTDEDYRRLLEFISMYWAEGGTNNFVKFISFIKNIRLECLPLWSVDTAGDDYPELEIKQDSMVPVWKGGTWYPTSHVELRYNPLLDQKQTNSNETQSFELYKGVEDIFYVFAPIQLVLERIVAAIDLYPEFFYGSSGQEMSQHFSKYEWKSYNEGFITDVFMNAGGMFELESGRSAYQWPMLRSSRGLQPSHQLNAQEYSIIKYEIPFLEQFNSLKDGLQISESFQSGTKYEWPILKNESTGGASTTYVMIVGNSVRYHEIPKLNVNIDSINSGMDMLYETLPPVRYVPNLFVPGIISDHQSSHCDMFFNSVRGSATFNDWDAHDGVPYPSKRINSLYNTVVMSEHTIIYAVNDRSTPLNFDVKPILGSLVIHILQARVESARRL